MINIKNNVIGFELVGWRIIKPYEFNKNEFKCNNIKSL